MATTKTKPKPKTKAKKPVVSKPAKRLHSRHVRFTLHPLTIFVELCVGVLLIASTVISYGDSYAGYNVSATVPGAVPTAPAIITQPADSSHVTDPTASISGSCPDGTYVTVTIGGISAGSANCNGGGFIVSGTLQAGANSLSAQDYNPLNQAGPSSPSVSVYYDQSNTTQVTPVAPPVSLQVMNVDSGIAYTNQSTVPVTSNLPTFQGVSTPFSQITVEVHSTPVYCYTQADANGYWQCTVATVLPVGEHTVYVSAVTDQGVKLTFPTFHLQVISHIAKPKPIATKPVIAAPTYAYKAYETGKSVSLNFPINGGNAPYSVTVEWGDGTSTTYLSPTANFSTSHTYHQTTSSLIAYTVRTEVVDSVGNTTSHQFIIYVRDPSYAAAAPAKPINPSGVQAFLTNVHNWLWLLWPSYTIIVLMFVSFWLGERRQFDRDRVPKRKKVVHRQRHA